MVTKKERNLFAPIHNWHNKKKKNIEKMHVEIIKTQ